jgi:hypothetical protein
VAIQGVNMPKRPIHGIEHTNRIQYETTAVGRKTFLEYWIHEWDGKGYELQEHIKDPDQAYKRALELGYKEDAKELEQFRQGSD